MAALDGLEDKGAEGSRSWEESMSNSPLIEAVDRFNRAAKKAEGADVVIPAHDAALLRGLICSVKGAQCALQDTGEACSCGLLDLKCPNRY